MLNSLVRTHCQIQKEALEHGRSAVKPSVARRCRSMQQTGNGGGDGPPVASGDGDGSQGDLSPVSYISITCRKSSPYVLSGDKETRISMSLCLVPGPHPVCLPDPSKTLPPAAVHSTRRPLIVNLCKEDGITKLGSRAVIVARWL